MEKILVIEDSKLLSGMIKRKIESETGLEVHLAEGFGEADELLSRNEYFAAVTDLNLPDAARGAMVDVLSGRGIPTIVFTGDYSDELRMRIWKKQIVDYVLKRDADSDKYISRLICQLRKNREIDVLVADDSIILRNSMKKLLETHLFRVHVCSNALEALEKLDFIPNLKLIISDYMMPGMDGFEFARAVRKRYPKDKVAFIGISGSQSEQTSAKFIKFGASDFMVKPFSNEQFYTRVNQNLQTMLMIENIRELSFKDYLTGLYNRRYFFMEMDSLFDNDANKSIALIDIDHFKNVNDTYGHDGGDEVLTALAGILSGYVEGDGFVSRFGGEEFCLYLYDRKEKDYFDQLRVKIENTPVSFRGKVIKITSSMGVASSTGKSVDEMITEADRLLYQAKTEGRNRVCYKG